MRKSITKKPNTMQFRSHGGGVVFTDVNFSYDLRLPTLKNVNFVVDPGATVALVGMTHLGKGKTTILRLLLRLYDVISDWIKIDGQDIRDLTLGSLCEAIGVVPQTPVLFSATILENLQYARPSTSDEKIDQASRAAAIHQKIQTFAGGYNTTVGEQGVESSGGELQRLAIGLVL
jgi:ABC-type multidrug transport system fused ATPase/permease subunit